MCGLGCPDAQNKKSRGKNIPIGVPLGKEVIQNGKSGGAVQKLREIRWGTGPKGLNHRRDQWK